jgi:CRISPR/Cas system-associated exonuclease Cas4 (RecB family)
MKYSITEMKRAPEGRPGRGGYRAVYNACAGAAVYENREVALKFAADVAHGLLDYIERDLQARVAVNRESIALLEDAVAELTRGKELSD